MGYWSAFIHSTTPEVRIDFSKLPKETLVFLNCKAEFNVSFNSETPPMTVDQLGKSLCTCAKIMGYLDEEMIQQLNGMCQGFEQTAEMTFRVDMDNVCFFTLRFDKLSNKMQLFVVNSKEDNELDPEEFVEKLKAGKIEWTNYEKSRQNSERMEFYNNIRKKIPGISEDLICLAMAMNGTL